MEENNADLIRVYFNICVYDMCRLNSDVEEGMPKGFFRWGGKGEVFKVSFKFLFYIVSFCRAFVMKSCIFDAEKK